MIFLKSSNFAAILAHHSHLSPLSRIGSVTYGDITSGTCISSACHISSCQAKIYLDRRKCLRGASQHVVAI